MTRVLPDRRILTGTIGVGLGAGILMSVAFIALNLLLRTVGFSVAGLFAFDASVLVGKVAYTSATFVGLGITLHLLVAIGWAVGYALASRSLPQLRTRPLISGAAFGFVIYFAMQLVIVAANLYVTPTPSELAMSLIAHMVFYGIPVALGIARLERPA